MKIILDSQEPTVPLCLTARHFLYGTSSTIPLFNIVLDTLSNVIKEKKLGNLKTGKEEK